MSDETVVSLRSHRIGKATAAYAEAVASLVGGEQAFFAQGKFGPFADAHGAGAPMPLIEVEVCFRDYRPCPGARALRDALKREGFRIEPAIRWAKGCRPKAGSTEQTLGARAVKIVTVAEAREIFERREGSHYGAYRHSQCGFRTRTVDAWDDRGVGFSVIGSGHDPRRPDKYGNAMRHEAHVVDDEADMAELSETFATIRRRAIGIIP